MVPVFSLQKRLFISEKKTIHNNVITQLTRKNYTIVNRTTANSFCWFLLLLCFFNCFIVCWFLFLFFFYNKKTPITDTLAKSSINIIFLLLLQKIKCHKNQTNKKTFNLHIHVTTIIIIVVV